MSVQQPAFLCQYRYDPLDRLINQTQTHLPTHQRFYCKSRLATEIHGAIGHSIFQHGDQLLAQLQREGDVIDSTLLATDLQRSVLHKLDRSPSKQSIAYTPYGHRPAECGLTSLLGFAGERPDPVTGHYLLGNGYRAFNPVLMRFNSPDSLSPFGRGGLNSYMYCLGDPINLVDEDGHSVFGVAFAAVRWRRFTRAKIQTKNEAARISETGKIHINHVELKSPVALKPGVTPQQALAARSQIVHLSPYSIRTRVWNDKYLGDLNNAKTNAISSGSIRPDENLKLLNYIKNPPDDKLVFSANRLFNAANGQFDPKVTLSDVPSHEAARRYRNVIRDMDIDYYRRRENLFKIVKQFFEDY
jgi:RHS repeat-associated protein